MVNARVGASNIDGLGLIAQELIPAGTVVWQFKAGFDLELPEEFVQELAEPARRQVLSYCDGDFDPKRRVYTLSGDDARFTNHSEHPNTACTPEGLETVALTDIHPGEEITWDYRYWRGEAE
ncbi:MAG: SET domain-containing protein [Pirellulaceae bacterium]